MDGSTSPEGASSWTPLSKPRKMSSKYDFVKVRVHLSWPSGHYYVLSRYLISRVLTVIKIPHEKAVKIAMQLKKYLVDTGSLEVSQEQMECRLFIIMAEKGYGSQFIERYKLMNRFFQQKKPVLIFICGAPYTGKSTLAQQLAARLNLPNVLQTDLIYELLRHSADSPLHNSPIWHRTDLSNSSFLSEYQRECCAVRKGVSGEINKVLAEGKSMIFEGVHLDPSMYVSELAAQGIRITSPSNASTRNFFSNRVPQFVNCKNGTLHLGNTKEICRTNLSCINNKNILRRHQILLEDCSGGDSSRQAMHNTVPPSELEPIFIPVVVTMEKGDHSVLACQWCSDSTNKSEFAAMFSKMRYLNDYLCKSSPKEVIVASLDISCMATALDCLHDHFLRCVERAMLPQV